MCNVRPWLATAAAVLLASAASAQERDFSKVEIQVTKVAGSVYMLKGAGGNIGASIGTDGIVLVDDQFAPLADKIQAALKNETSLPVRFVINTHWHGDHTGGNVPFGKVSTLIAQENVRTRLQSDGVAGNGGSIHRDEPAQPKEALPIITFKQDLTVHLNGEDIEAVYVPAGHTDGDSVVFFRGSNVVHMGDDFVTYGFPFIDVDSGGSIKGMIAGLDTVIAKLPPDVKVIPGHGALSTLDDVRAFRQMLVDTSAVIEKAIADGRTLEQMQKAKILEKWQKYSGDFVSTDVYIETVYNSLTGKKGSGFVKH
jgi:glyoxylase-like metal-dependent hydrolase (beta-lactamase superfamily II)